MNNRKLPFLVTITLCSTYLYYTHTKKAEDFGGQTNKFHNGKLFRQRPVYMIRKNTELSKCLQINLSLEK